MGLEFVQIFSQMGVVSIVTLIAGIVLLFTEMFMPGFGICGILGIISMVVGVVFRIVDGASFFQAAVLIAFLIVIIVIVFFVVIRSADKGIISKTPLVQSKTAIPQDYGKKDNIDLLDKEGVVTTQCKPVGKALIDGETYDVMAKDGFLIKGVKVKVVEVLGDEIYVEKLKEDIK